MLAAIEHTGQSHLQKVSFSQPFLWLWRESVEQTKSLDKWVLW